MESLSFGEGCEIRTPASHTNSISNIFIYLIPHQFLLMRMKIKNLTKFKNKS